MYNPNPERDPVEHLASHRRGLVRHGVGSLENVVYVTFGPAPQVEAQPAPAITPEAQLAKVYSLDDQRRPQPEPAPAPEVAIHENQSEIEAKQAMVDEAFKSGSTEETDHGTAQAA